MLSSKEAVGSLGDLDREDAFDVLLLRGAEVSEAAIREGRFDGRLWLYHVPVRDEAAEEVRRRGKSAHRILCQTAEIEASVLKSAPELGNRLLRLPPMIPPPEDLPQRPKGPVRRLVYTGKISPEYYFVEMVELLGRLREKLPGLELHVAGDKIHNPPDDPGFRNLAERALTETDGLIWHGAMPREQIPNLVRSADIALSIRHPSLDASPEMSTKVLEYGAAGTPVLLNATRTHMTALGHDYPLLATNLDDAERAILAASADPETRAEAAVTVHRLSSNHGFDRIAESLAPHLSEIPAHAMSGAGPRLLVAGHNLNFVRPLLRRAEAAGAEVREDSWQGHAGGGGEASDAALDWAEVIFCEWCLGNAVWFSRRADEKQRLVVRFHRMELETGYPTEVELDRVDAMVFVAQHVLERACKQFGWPLDAPELSVVPNAVDCNSLKRPKLPGAEFNLGLIGYVPMIKRLDRAIEILERLRVLDKRYRLIVKGRGPWEYSWMAARERERTYYEDMFRRIDRSAILRGAVTFEPFGEDIGEFLQQIGWIVSSSEIEGHSVALAEGMASGAIPVVIDRVGARDQYELHWVHANPGEAAKAIIETAERGLAGAESKAASAFAERWDWSQIGQRWDRILGVASSGPTTS